MSIVCVFDSTDNSLISCTNTETWESIVYSPFDVVIFNDAEPVFIESDSGTGLKIDLNKMILKKI